METLYADRIQSAAMPQKSIRELRRKSVALPPRNGHPLAQHSSLDCNQAPSERLVLKIAESREELEACFAVLHDAYVESGFMKPHPSGLRVTVYHALPSTTMLCAKFDGWVVGTVSLIRENALGFPMQRIFDLSTVREKGGQIAEVSALAIHPKFRRTSGSILFPLMKTICEYCTTVFDIRHLVIAVNPRHIELYESLLFFRRLTANPVENYDFANGAAAVGATLDIRQACEELRAHYASKPASGNLYDYFTQISLANIKLPDRGAYANGDPALPPELLDYFFNVRTRVFDNLDEHQTAILHSIYHRPEYGAVLPPLTGKLGRMRTQPGSAARGKRHNASLSSATGLEQPAPG